MFATGRAFEQIRNSIGYPHLNVKVCASHAGLTVGEDGASHQSIEDISLMRGIPGMTVICPADAVETDKVIRAVAEIDGPCYVRLGRSAVETVYSEDMAFEVGKGALQAYDELKEKGYEPTVVDMHTIKPIDKDLLVELAKSHDLFVTCEEHSVIGGLGSTVAETLSQYAPTKIKMVGVQDTFGESGTPAGLLEKYGLTSKDIVKAVIEE